MIHHTLIGMWDSVIELFHLQIGIGQLAKVMLQYVEQIRSTQGTITATYSARYRNISLQFSLGLHDTTHAFIMLLITLVNVAPYPKY